MFRLRFDPTAKNGVDTNKVNTLRITLVMIILSMLISFIEYSLHYQDPDPTFANQQWLFIAFNSAFFVLLIFGQVRFVTIKQFGGWRRLFIETTITILSIFMIQIIIGFFFRPKYAITPIEIFLFYINAAISEEILYRMTLIHAPRMIFRFIVNNRVKPSGRKIYYWIIDFVLIFVTSAIFSASHYNVYKDLPLMFIATFLGGLVFAISFVFSRNNILPAIIAHVLNNAIAAGVIIQGMVIEYDFILMMIIINILLILIFIFLKTSSRNEKEKAYEKNFNQEIDNQEIKHKTIKTIIFMMIFSLTIIFLAWLTIESGFFQHYKTIAGLP